MNDLHNAPDRQRDYELMRERWLASQAELIALRQHIRELQAQVKLLTEKIPIRECHE